MSTPYSGLPARAFWKTGVAARAPLDPGDIYRPRFALTRNMSIVTAGSCFAQHVGRALRGAGLRLIDAEPPPAGVPEPLANRFGYRLYSARYGNIYTAAHLWQLWQESTGALVPAEPVWQREGRYFDAQRPGVEPEGLCSPDEVHQQRAGHLAKVRQVFTQADLFVFTFGLTEGWVHRATGTVYPTAPGTIAGRFDPDTHAFHNFGFIETLAAFEALRTALLAVRPGMRFLVTVSPVPLAATAADAHVEVATCYSKSVLRAVCGELVARHDNVDYFPSFEIITSQQARGVHYMPDGRQVSAAGVATAMRVFLASHGLEAASEAQTGHSARHDADTADTAAADEDDDLICEDRLLEAFTP